MVCLASSNNYHILVKAILDESNLQGQINKAASKIKNVKIGDAGTKTATSGFNKMNQAIDKTSQSMSDIIKRLLSGRQERKLLMPYIIPLEVAFRLCLS